MGLGIEQDFKVRLGWPLSEHAKQVFRMPSFDRSYGCIDRGSPMVCLSSNSTSVDPDSDLNPGRDEISRIRENVRWSFDDLLQRWDVPIRCVARKYSTKSTHQDDLFQVGSLALHRAVQTFEPGRSKFTTYANTLIRNAMKDLRRSDTRAAVQTVLASDCEDDDFKLDDAEGIEYPDRVVQAEEVLAVHVWLDQLGERDRFVVDSHFYRGVSLTAIAAELGLSKARVSQILSDLRQVNPMAA
jgi:RNA polymerase sigma factor (sigma-70 family)